MRLKNIQISILVLLTSIASLSAQMSIEKLDDMAALSFSIMSDNKGYSVENPHMKKCDQWIRDAGNQFILGLGDHVKKNRANPFLDLIKNDSLWHHRFYPNVADGENGYWGFGQEDWGAGAPILDYVDLAKRKNVKIRDNNCEYYAVEEHNGIRVHIIQLHYSDDPPDPTIGLNENTRNYLMDVLDSINKTDNDIIVVLAHTGNWVEQLSKERKSKLLAKADLVLGATTHHYQRYYFSENDNDSGAIGFNTGAVGNSGENGFIQVHVLKNPTRLVAQYQITNNDTRVLREKGFAYEKIINGEIKEIDWDAF